MATPMRTSAAVFKTDESVVSQGARNKQVRRRSRDDRMIRSERHHQRLRGREAERL